MLAVLPLSSLVVYALLMHRRGWSPRSAMLAAAVLWAVTLTAMTELLSFFRALSPGSLAGAWGVVLVCTIAAWLSARQPSRSGTERQERQVGIRKPVRLPPKEATCVVGIGLILSGTLLTALVAAPNNWDSMTYHMARVAHWSQNQSVAHYPTSIPRQLYLGPGAEFVILHFQILTGGDRLANVIQWLSAPGHKYGDVFSGDYRSP